MGSVLSALLYLGFGAGWSLLASNMQHAPRQDKKRRFVGNMVVGSTGAWLGGTLFGAVGPTLYGVSLLATAISSASAVMGYQIISKGIDKKSTGNRNLEK